MQRPPRRSNGQCVESDDTACTGPYVDTYVCNIQNGMSFFSFCYRKILFFNACTTIIEYIVADDGYLLSKVIFRNLTP